MYIYTLNPKPYSVSSEIRAEAVKTEIEVLRLQD